MTVRQMIVDFFEKECFVGLFGLCNSDNDCGCGLDDIQLCDSYCMNCKAASWNESTQEYEEII